jgi:hypothetical protein
MAAFKPEKKLWVAMSVNHPVFVLGVDKQLVIQFVVVNDGDMIINPELESTTLLINGKEWKNWGTTIGGGPRDNRDEALPSGDYLNSTIDFTDRFKEPGIYKLTWKGKGFQAADLVFRVLPKPKQPDGRGLP